MEIAWTAPQICKMKTMLAIDLDYVEKTLQAPQETPLVTGGRQETSMAEKDLLFKLKHKREIHRQ